MTSKSHPSHFLYQRHTHHPPATLPAHHNLGILGLCHSTSTRTSSNYKVRLYLLDVSRFQYPRLAIRCRVRSWRIAVSTVGIAQHIDLGTMATSVEMISAAPGAMLDSRWNATAAHALPTPTSDRYNNSATTRQQQQCTAASSSTPVSTPPATSSKAETTSTHKSCTPGILGDQEVDPLIVFDWDDTMLTSSWIQARDLLQAGSYDDLPECARRELAHLEHR